MIKIKFSLLRDKNKAPERKKELKMSFNREVKFKISGVAG